MSQELVNVINNFNIGSTELRTHKFNFKKKQNELSTMVKLKLVFIFKIFNKDKKCQKYVARAFSQLSFQKTNAVILMIQISQVRQQLLKNLREMTSSGQ